MVLERCGFCPASRLNANANAPTHQQNSRTLHATSVHGHPDRCTREALNRHTHILRRCEAPGPGRAQVAEVLKARSFLRVSVLFCLVSHAPTRLSSFELQAVRDTRTPPHTTHAPVLIVLALALQYMDTWAMDTGKAKSPKRACLDFDSDLICKGCRTPH